MEYNVGAGLGNAASWALAGAQLGPWGAIGGGLAGLATGLFGPEDEPIVDPRTAQLDALAFALQKESDVGAKQANAIERQVRDQAREGYGQLMNNAAVQSNPALASALYNKINREAERGTSEARVAGARLDQDIEFRNQSQAANILGSNRAFDYAKQLEEYKRKRQPGFFEGLASTAITTSIGRFLGKDFGGKETTTPGGIPNVPPVTPGGGGYSIFGDSPFGSTPNWLGTSTGDSRDFPWWDLSPNVSVQ